MNSTTQNSKVALIVGGTTGMGKAAARSLLERGATVRIVGRSEDRLAKAAAELATSGKVETYKAVLFRPDNQTRCLGPWA